MVLSWGFICCSDRSPDRRRARCTGHLSGAQPLSAPIRRRKRAPGRDLLSYAGDLRSSNSCIGHARCDCRLRALLLGNPEVLRLRGLLRKARRRGSSGPPPRLLPSPQLAPACPSTSRSVWPRRIPSNAFTIVDHASAACQPCACNRGSARRSTACSRRTRRTWAAAHRCRRTLPRPARR